jgi:dolichyl-phosphate-mannose--protein O-mannosyl transferase
MKFNFNKNQIFKLTILIIFIFSVIIRFWKLTQFNTLVFDEVYYAKFANNYLIGEKFFNAHPPVSQYAIAIGIWLGKYFPASADTINNLTGSNLSTFSYRWLNALTGSFIPVLIAAIAYQLNPNRLYAIIAALFTALDGLLLVQSRYALNDIYIVFFGLLAHLFFLLALRSKFTNLWSNLTIVGIFLGICIATKWNGLGFLFGIGLTWIVSWSIAIISHPSKFINSNRNNKFKLTLFRVTQLDLFKILICLILVPIIIYSLCWIPHLKMNPQFGFVEVHQQIFNFHKKLGADVHPYCALWYTWIIMSRPIAIFYATAKTIEEPIPLKSQVAIEKAQVIYDVHGMGNPFLWWLSLVAICILLIALIIIFISPKRSKYLNKNYIFVPIYLVVNYAANLLPWIPVKRCLFIYHYLPALPFAFMSLAWVVTLTIQNKSTNYRIWGYGIIAIAIIGFIFWLPLYLGLPLSPQTYRWRMWFNSWI